MQDKKTIVITVEGGLIQWIAGIPEDVRIVVKDYDVDSVDEENLTTDENGDEYVESVWDKEDEDPRME